GWTYAKYLLEFERGGQAFGPRLRKALRHLKELAHTQMEGGEPLSQDPKWREKVTELAVEAVGWYGAPFTELRNYDSNIVPVGGEYVDDVAPRYFNQRKTTIYGGSSEVQRNVLAKAMLGL